MSKVFETADVISLALRLHYLNMFTAATSIERRLRSGEAIRDTEGVDRSKYAGNMLASLLTQAEKVRALYMENRGNFGDPAFLLYNQRTWQECPDGG